jgi:microcystin-dependent protein
MGQPFVGEIRIFAGNFAPVGWMLCQGQTLPIAEYDILFQLIGTTYGGDGQQTFNLPNLQSRIPIHMGTGRDGTPFQIGEMSGTEQVTLTVQQLPIHSHQALGASTGQVTSPANAVLANATSTQTGLHIYSTGAANVALNSSAISNQGGSQPHDNTQPFLCLNFIISLFGLFPSPT